MGKQGIPIRGATPNRAVPSEWDLKSIVEQLRISREVTHSVRHLGRVRELPSPERIAEIVDRLRAALFPTHYGDADFTDESIDFFVGDTLNVALNLLCEELRRGMQYDGDTGSASPDDLLQAARTMTRGFAAELPQIRALVVSDVQAAYQGDPAAASVSEVLLCYPGTTAIMLHRFAHALHHAGARLVARLIAEIAHTRTGVDIHPGATIGGSFFIDHGSGVVIGETTVIGERVRLYQAVTLGAKRFPADEDGRLIKGVPRHPIVEDDVIIYAGATLLGRITIGTGSTIGGNVWLTHSVGPGSSITQAKMQSG